ncbi:MAG: phosphoglucomutase/phosphomannomutase family protein [Anaerolineaceae bacterium]|jgi:alpha-D-glucose phosphate-specific phosphoglucomutase|nr:phosphoglucomutase/phosphomannomutase family protein [Anaerolineaceae bacterium]
MTYKIIFGTDGWRAQIAAGYTFDNVRRCAQGFANYYLEQGKAGEAIVIGYDKRFASEYFARAAAEVMVGNGFRVFLTDSATPTPVISFAVPQQGAVGGINITASHNPPTDNGFKVRDENGGAIPPKGLKKIESLIPNDTADIKMMPADQATEKGLLSLFDAKPAYMASLKDKVDLQAIRDAGLKIVVDPMWGNGAGWFPEIIGGGKTETIEIHNTRNPLFPEMIRPEPIQPNIDVGLQTTIDENADVLLIMDGDADRCGMGDENGMFINQLRVYALLAYYFLEIRQERGTIVKTLSTTSMLNILGEQYNVPVVETGVGFKYVAPKMMETNAMIGGEESGGYAFRNHVPERDGILGGLYFLDLMVRTGKKPSELLKVLFDKVGEHFYDRIDTRFTGDKQARIDRILAADPETIGGLKVLSLDTTDGFKFNLEDGGWLLIRFSGTEPVIRVYCETTHQDCVQAILKDGLRIAGIE